MTPKKATLGKTPATLPKFAFQGELGAFSQVAAKRMAQGDFTPVPFSTFEAAFSSVINGKAQAAVIPIENTLHGSVHENYDHLLKFDLQIFAETSVRIVHNLIVPPGVTFADVTTVYSHPVALNQCRRFFEEHPKIVRTPHYDTAGSVKTIMEQGLRNVAAIASAEAASIYGARILKRSIEDDRENYTRFFLLRKPAGRNKRATQKPLMALKTVVAEKAALGKGWKVSIVFTTKNLPGALFRCLSVFSLRDISLTKIESRPLRGKPWEYLFYLDFLGHLEDSVVTNALRHLEELADMLRILGCYPAAH